MRFDNNITKWKKTLPMPMIPQQSSNLIESMTILVTINEREKLVELKQKDPFNQSLLQKVNNSGYCSGEDIPKNNENFFENPKISNNLGFIHSSNESLSLSIGNKPCIQRNNFDLINHENHSMQNQKSQVLEEKIEGNRQQEQFTEKVDIYAEIKTKLTRLQKIDFQKTDLYEEIKARFLRLESLDLQKTDLMEGIKKQLEHQQKLDLEQGQKKTNNRREITRVTKRLVQQMRQTFLRTRNVTKTAKRLKINNTTVYSYIGDFISQIRKQDKQYKAEKPKRQRK